MHMPGTGAPPERQLWMVDRPVRSSPRWFLALLLMARLKCRR